MRGEEIPLAVRIFAVADAFDAITTNRPYRRARPVADAIQEIERCSGTQFDPAVVDAFLQLGDQLANAEQASEVEQTGTLGSDDGLEPRVDAQGGH